MEKRVFILAWLLLAAPRHATTKCSSGRVAPKAHVMVPAGPSTHLCLRPEDPTGDISLTLSMRDQNSQDYIEVDLTRKYSGLAVSLRYQHSGDILAKVLWPKRVLAPFLWTNLTLVLSRAVFGLHAKMDPPDSRAPPYHPVARPHLLGIEDDEAVLIVSLEETSVYSEARDISVLPMSKSSIEYRINCSPGYDMTWGSCHNVLIYSLAASLLFLILLLAGLLTALWYNDQIMTLCKCRRKKQDVPVLFDVASQIPRASVQIMNTTLSTVKPKSSEKPYTGTTKKDTAQYKFVNEAFEAEQ